jgi:GNAT superfamily N-acetyltransferase
MGIGLVHVRSWQAAYRGLVPEEFLDGLDPVQRAGHWERQLSAEGEQPELVLVAEVDGQVVGFAAIGPSRDEDGDRDGEVRAIYLTAEHWGQGIGTALMGSALDVLRRAGFSGATLWVLATNERGRRFYETGGWAPDGAVKEDDSRGFPITEVRYRRALS